MSESDDTDYLLLIPPDFFTVNTSDQESLINENFRENSRIEAAVNVLANRVEDICDRLTIMETTSPSRSSSLHEHSLYTSPFHAKNELLPISDKCYESRLSLCNTWPIKANSANLMKAKYKMNDIPSLSGTDSSKGNNAELLYPSSKFNLYQVDKLIRQMEETRAEIRSKLQLNRKQISLLKNRFPNRERSLDESFNQNLVLSGLEDSSNGELSSKEERKSSQYEENAEIEANQKNASVNELLTLPRESKSMLSISKVICDESSVETLQQKLEAETLKRKHCEELIQKLQLDLLEQQENLAVALKVDVEREEFIKRLQGCWTQLVDHWKELENQRQELATMLEQERAETRKLAAASTQKITNLENRLAETYDLVANYEDKNKHLEKLVKDLQTSVEDTKIEFEKRVSRAEANAKQAEIEKLEILEQMDHVNDNLLDEKQRTLEAETRIVDLEKLISVFTQEKQDMVQSLQMEKKIAETFKTEIIKLKLNYDLASNAEAATAKEITRMKQEMIKMKNNLKEFYQKQLDGVLKEKVQEFQKQIQSAEVIMHEELHKQGKLANEKLQNEIERLQNEYKLELSEERRINLKHVNILKAELKESRKKFHEFERRLKSNSSPRMELTENLQSLMENQWLKSLNKFSRRNTYDKDFNFNENLISDEEVVRNDRNVVENGDHFNHIPVDLKRYIKMLLDRPPGDPTDKASQSVSSSNVDVKTKSEAPKSSPDDLKKPPWK